MKSLLLRLVLEKRNSAENFRRWEEVWMGPDRGREASEEESWLPGWRPRQEGGGLLCAFHCPHGLWPLLAWVFLSFPWRSNSPKLRNPSRQEEGYRKQLMVLAIQEDSEARLKPNIRGQATTEMRSHQAERAQNRRQNRQPTLRGQQLLWHQDAHLSLVVPQSIQKPLISSSPRREKSWGLGIYQRLQLSEATGIAICQAFKQTES